MTPALLVTALVATLQGAPLSPGTVIDNVPSRSDPGQTYTLYLPSAYETSRRWPLLLVFDPRGRGAVATEAFREAAEAFGWIVVTSNNIRTGGPWEPNGRALAALWPSVLQVYSVDPRRVYAAGFSAGTDVAWVLARNTGAVAGLIAAGAPARKELDPRGARLAWFGSAGRLDFNYLDARELDDRMNDAGLPHRLEFFDGPHQWPTPDIARLAISWLEALAMKAGLRPRDDNLTARLVAEEMARAKQLESAGRLVEARRALGAIADTYADLADVTNAVERIKFLDAGEALARASRGERRADGWERSRRDEAALTIARLTAEEIPHARQVIQDLNIASLQRRARRPGYEGEAAGRVLESIYIQTALYVPEALEERRDFARAAIVLEVAAAIHADRPGVWFNLAADRAMVSARKDALAALKKAIELGFSNRQLLVGDPRLASLRGTPEYKRLIETIPDK